MIERLHYITQEGPNGESHAMMARRACESGVKWVQLRIKNAEANYIQEQAEETLTICRKFGATMILNDHVDISLKVGTDGIHLGKTDMDASEARKILGNKIIGGTANTYEDICSLIQKGVDYVGLGPFRFTSTKEKLSPILGLEGYQDIFNQMMKAGQTTPVVGIGGLQSRDLCDLRKAGAHGVAIASLINHAEDQATIVKELNNALL